MGNKSFESIQHSWTQPYLPTDYNPFYQPSPEYVATEEMIRLNAVDEIVDCMNKLEDQLRTTALARKMLKDIGVICE
jgi:hypothetical protein